MISCVDDFYVQNHRPPYTSEIAAMLGIVKSTVHKYLVDMNERGMLSYHDGVICTEMMRKFSMNTKPAAIVGSISCGTPFLEEENIEEYIPLPVAIFGNDDYFILRANGDSMVNAGISDGSLVVIRKQTTAEEGQIVAALVENESTLKRFFIDQERQCVRLHPENEDYSDILTNDCKIQGVAVSVINSLK